MYAIRKEGLSDPSAVIYFNDPTPPDDTAQGSLRKGYKPRRVPSNVSIEKFLNLVNSSTIGNAVLSRDVIEKLESVRRNEPNVTQYLKFSLADTAPADVDALMKENAQYKEAIEDLKAQFELTKGHKVSREAVEKIAKGIIRKYKSSYELDTLTDNMMKMFDYIGNAEQVAWDEVVKVASAYGKEGDLQNFIDTSKMLFVDTNKTRVHTWLKLYKLQLPSSVKYGLNSKITYKNAPVKNRISESAENDASEGGNSYSAEDGKSSILEKDTLHNADLFDKSTYDYDRLIQLKDMKVLEPASFESIFTNEKIEQTQIIDKGIKNAERSSQVAVNDTPCVHNTYTGRLVMVGKGGIGHSLDGKFRRIATNARLSSIADELVENAVPLNAAKKDADHQDDSYLMVGYAVDKEIDDLQGGWREFIAIITVDSSMSVTDIEPVDVLHSINGRNKRHTLYSESGVSQEGIPMRMSKISIVDLLEIVKELRPDILSKSVLDHFGMEVSNGYYSDKVRFSLQDTAPADVDALIGKKKGWIFTKNIWKTEINKDGTMHRMNATAPTSTSETAVHQKPSDNFKVSKDRLYTHEVLIANKDDVQLLFKTRNISGANATPGNKRTSPLTSILCNILRVKYGISESAENDASKGKNSYSSKDVDETPEQRYYRYGWAVDNGLLSRREMADFFFKLKHAIDSDFQRTSDGNYIVEVGEEQGINNVVIVAGNIYTMPSYERIYRIDKFTETEIEKIRNKIYEREKRQSNYEMRDVGTVFGEEFVETYDRNDVPTFRKFSRNSTRAKREISRTNNKHYRFEQDGEGDARENTTPDSTEQKINFSLQDTAPADVDALTKENVEYKEAIEDLKAQFELTKGHKVSRCDIIS